MLCTGANRSKVRRAHAAAPSIMLVARMLKLNTRCTERGVCDTCCAVGLATQTCPACKGAYRPLLALHVRHTR